MVNFGAMATIVSLPKYTLAGCAWACGYKEAVLPWNALPPRCPDCGTVVLYDYDLTKEQIREAHPGVI